MTRVNYESASIKPVMQAHYNPTIYLLLTIHIKFSGKQFEVSLAYNL